MSFHKRGTRAEIAFELAGLADLKNAGARVAHVEGSDDTSLRTTTITEVSPTEAHAADLGHMLADLHAPVDRVFGQAPPGFDLDEHGHGAMGREALPLVPAGAPARSWGEFYAEDRILAYLDGAMANSSITDPEPIHRLCEKLRDGAFESSDPSIIHGDLWSGNVMWSSSGPVLIDPACHTGHRESDLAQLAFFGAPHLETILAAYNESFPLAGGWRERVFLHQIHIAIVHAALFGGSYGRQTMSLVATYL